MKFSGLLLGCGCVLINALNEIDYYRIAGKLGRGKFGKLIRFEHLAKESLAN